MHDKDLTYILYIAAPPERVWEALTNGESTRQYWFGRSIESSWGQGDKITIHAPDGSLDVFGEILEHDPPRVLAYTFNITGFPPSRVRIELVPFGDVTRLTLTHIDHTPEPLPADAPEIQRRGWMIILNGLKTLVETGKPLPGDASVFMR